MLYEVVCQSAHKALILSDLVMWPAHSPPIRCSSIQTSDTLQQAAVEEAATDEFYRYSKPALQQNSAIDTSIYHRHLRLPTLRSFPPPPSS